MANDRKSRKDELLAAARDRLTAEQDERSNDGPEDRGPVIRYRGQVVRQRAAATPGSTGISPRRGGSGAAGTDDVRAALEKIKALYRDGLISRAEAEKKRSEILDRM